MLSTLVIEILLCSLWGTKSFAIVSLASSPLFTMESLNDTVTDEPKQAFTVPLDVDLETTETDPVTDGGTQVSSQIAITSTVTPVLSNVTNGVKNNIKPQELSTRSIDPIQPISLDVFNITITETAVTAVDTISKETGNNRTLIPLLDTNKADPFEEHLGSYLEIPMENSTAGKQCSCNIPGPEGQKGDKGDRGDPGQPGKNGKRGPQGFEGIKGENGVQGETGSRGDKGGIGPMGPKGDPGVRCALCEAVDHGLFANDSAIELRGKEGEPGYKGIKGDMGPKGDPGEKGSMGMDGIPGIPGEAGPNGSPGQRGSVGLKGDQGKPGAMGPPGYGGPPGIQGRKGERGQKGFCAEHIENIAFSVAVRGNRNILLPGQPMRFDRVFVNDNKPYNVNSGIFVASIEGVYFFSYQISSSQPSLVVGLAHNGKVIVQTQAWHSQQNVCQASGSVLLHLSEDDEIWLQVLNVAPNGYISDESTSLFSGFILYSLED